MCVVGNEEIKIFMRQKTEKKWLHSGLRTVKVADGKAVGERKTGTTSWPGVGRLNESHRNFSLITFLLANAEMG